MNKKQWKELCKDCYCPPLNKALSEYANTPEYLRRLITEVKIEEVFEYIETKCNLWDTDDIRNSSETKSGDKWLSMNIVEKVKKRFIKEVMEE